MLFLSSCQGDDDVCVSGEATPRMKVKFKSADGRVATLDSLYVDINYGSGLVNVIKAKSIDSVTIPLRVDNNPFTEISLRTTNKGNSSKVKIKEEVIFIGKKLTNFSGCTFTMRCIILV